MKERQMFPGIFSYARKHLSIKIEGKQVAVGNIKISFMIESVVFF